jgi:hypothetical protein
MKVKAEELWDHIGTVFINPKDLYAKEHDKYLDEDYDFLALPKGTYLIIDTDDSVVNLYDIQKNMNYSFEPYFVQDQEFETMYIDPVEMLKLAVDSMIKRIMTLTAEGWTVDPENKYFNLTPELQKLAGLKYALGIVSPESLREIENANKNQ